MGLLRLIGVVIAGLVTTDANLITVLNIQGFGYVTAGLLAILLLPARRPAQAPVVIVSAETAPEQLLDDRLLAD
jgi:hypothetical protein